MDDYIVAVTDAYAADTLPESEPSASAAPPAPVRVNVTTLPEPNLEARVSSLPEFGEAVASASPERTRVTTSVDYWAAYLAPPHAKGDDGTPRYFEYGDLGMIIDRIPGRTNGLLGSTYPGGEPGKMFKVNAKGEEMERQFLPRITLYVEEIGDHLYATQRIAPHEGSHNRQRDFPFVNAEGAALHEQYTRSRTSTAQPGVGFYTA